MLETPIWPIAIAAMRIVAPVTQVFSAFTDPDICRHFWIPESSGPLVPGATVTWSWPMFAATATVHVTDFVPNRRLSVSWGSDTDRTRIDWQFTPLADDSTFVEIHNSGFGGELVDQVAAAIGSTEGFTLALAGLKAWLEHGIHLNLVADRFPSNLPTDVVFQGEP